MRKAQEHLRDLIELFETPAPESWPDETERARVRPVWVRRDAYSGHPDAADTRGMTHWTAAKRLAGEDS